MLYPAKFDLDEGRYVVTFRDIPEAMTQGYSLDEARDMALDALVTALDFYFNDQKMVPLPSIAEDEEQLIELPVSIWSKILLLNTMLEARISQSDLAKKMNKSRQEMQRIIDLKHNTKIDTVVEALKILGKNPTFII